MPVLHLKRPPEQLIFEDLAVNLRKDRLGLRAILETRSEPDAKRQLKRDVPKNIRRSISVIWRVGISNDGEKSCPTFEREYFTDAT